MDGCGGAQVRVTSQRHAILFSSFSFLVKTIINPKSQIPNPVIPMSPSHYHPSPPKCRRSHGIASVLLLSNTTLLLLSADDHMGSPTYSSSILLHPLSVTTSCVLLSLFAATQASFLVLLVRV
jgi:hypothetical protein